MYVSMYVNGQSYELSCLFLFMLLDYLKMYYFFAQKFNSLQCHKRSYAQLWSIGVTMDGEYK